MRWLVALPSLVLTSCTLDYDGLADDAAGAGAGSQTSTADASSGATATSGASSSSGSSGGGSSTTTASAGGSGGDGTATGGGAASGGGDAGTGGSGGDAGSGGAGGEGGSPPLLGEGPCDGLAVAFVDENIDDELAGTSWDVRGSGRAESGGGVLRVEGDEEWVEIFTNDQPLDGCSVTVTLKAITSIEAVASANISAIVDWPDAVTDRRGIDIELGNAGQCAMRFGLANLLADANPRVCDATSPITVRLRHTGSELCYDVKEGATFDVVGCVPAPGPLDPAIGGSSPTAFDFQYADLL